MAAVHRGENYDADNTATFSGSRFASLLSAIQEHLDHKLAEFKADVRQAQDDAAGHVRHDKPYTFKKKAHEEQARFNGKVEESIQEAQDALANLKEFPAHQRAQEALEKVRSFLPKGRS